MSYLDSFKVFRHNGQEAKEGDELLVDRNLTATFVSIDCPPWEDEETGECMPGRINVRYTWGEVASVEEGRAGVFVDEA